jgi:hypothetical protein
MCSIDTGPVQRKIEEWTLETIVGRHRETAKKIMIGIEYS